MSYRFIHTQKRRYYPYERPYKTTQYFDTEEDARDAMLKEIEWQSTHADSSASVFFHWHEAYAAYLRDGKYTYPYSTNYSYLYFDANGGSISTGEYLHEYRVEQVDAQKDAERLAQANEGHIPCTVTGIGCIIAWLIMLLSDPQSMNPLRFFGIAVFLLMGIILLIMSSKTTQDDIDNGRG